MELKELRNRIDVLDDELLKLFLQRMELCSQVAEAKAQSKKPVADAGREREILSRVTRSSPEELAGYARELYSTLFRLSRSYQHSKMPRSGALSELIAGMADKDLEFPKAARVACQGIEGAYSQQACDKVFSFADITFFRSFEGVFNAVEKGLCDYGVLPIENSSHGIVREVYDLMRSHSFYIVRSTSLQVKHDLLALPGSELGGIKEIVSHEQAIGQCSRLLASMPGVRVTLCENTAVAAKMVAESGRSDIAALSSPVCAGMYGLEALKTGVQDSDNNHTRFIVIGKKPVIYPGANRISILFSTPNTAGALSGVLSRLADIGVNLTRLESRPIAGTDFEYVFYADLDGSVRSPELRAMLDELSGELRTFVFLGSYSEI
ncbi:MAG: chorismate mutase [Oscillospiraceae bacterium]|nr:chorismate mutase [Oscillospiraceae bacterium]